MYAKTNLAKKRTKFPQCYNRFNDKTVFEQVKIWRQIYQCCSKILIFVRGEIAKPVTFIIDKADTLTVEYIIARSDATPLVEPTNNIRKRFVIIKLFP